MLIDRDPRHIRLFDSMPLSLLKADLMLSKMRSQDEDKICFTKLGIEKGTNGWSPFSYIQYLYGLKRIRWRRGRSWGGNIGRNSKRWYT